MSELSRALLLLGLFALPAVPAATQPQPRPAADLLPPGAVARLGGAGLRHNGTVEVLAFAPDGKTLASAGQDVAIRLWDTTTGRERARFPLPGGRGEVRQLAFSPDGKVLAFTGLEQVVFLWDAATGKPLHELRLPPRVGKGSPRFALAPDGKKLASWSPDFTIRLWDTGTGRQLALVAKLPRRLVWQMEFAPDGRTLATVYEDGHADLWDTVKGQARPLFRDPRHWCYALAVSPDGKTIATGGRDNVRLWDAVSGKERQRLPGLQSRILALAFAADGQSLCVASASGEGRVWRVQDGKELQRIQLVAHSDTANPVAALAFSGDGNTLAWVAWGSRTRIRLSDVRTGKERPEGVSQPSAALIAFAPDGKTAVTPCEDDRLRLWETATGNPVRAFDGQAGKVFWLGFAPDGKTLLTVGQEVIFWDVATGKEVRRRAAPQTAFNWRTCALAPGGKVLAVGEEPYSRWPQKGRVFLWDLEAGKERDGWQGVHGSMLSSVAFSADGKYLASAGRFDDTVRLWDVATGKVVRHWFTEGHNVSVAFADGGKSLVASSGYHKDGKEAFRVVRWELITGKERDRWEGISLGVANLPPLFSPEGRALACVRMPEGIDLYHPNTGKVIRRLQTGQQGYTLPIGFSPDGRLLATWHGNSTILLWDVGRQQ